MIAIQERTEDAWYCFPVAGKSPKRAEIVSAATDFIEQYGVVALTMRALGKHIGADPSVVYR